MKETKATSSSTPMSKELAQMLLQMKTAESDRQLNGNHHHHIDTNTSTANESKEVTKVTSLLSHHHYHHHHIKHQHQQLIGKDRKNALVKDEKLMISSSSSSSSSEGREVCNCKKSRCLKLYCQCFSNKIACDVTCRCVSCSNTDDDIDIRNQAIQAILDRNPNAFDSKFQVAEVVDGEVTHKTGCRCRKSMCLKKYCECYQASIPCSVTCTCLHCCNQASSASALLVNGTNGTIGMNYSAAISVLPGASTPLSYIPPRPESEDVLARAARDLELLRSLTSASKALFDTDIQVNVKLLELHRPQIEKALSSITTDLSSSSSSSSAGLPPLPPGKSKRNFGQMDNVVNNNSVTSPATFDVSPGNDNSDGSVMIQNSIRSASPNSINVASALSLLGVHNLQKSSLHPDMQTQHHLAIHDTTSEEDYDNSSDSSEYRDKNSENGSVDHHPHFSKKHRSLSEVDDEWGIREN